MTCPDCAHTKTEPHAYDTDYTSLNASNHRRTCTTAGCGHTETEAHTYAHTDNSNGTHTMDCTRCGYSRRGLHAYEGDTCGNCGYHPKPVMADGTIDDTGALTKYTGSAAAVEIPYGVTRIRNYAFRDCRSLTSVTIPDSVIDIGTGAFNGCTSLTTVNYGGTMAEWNAIVNDSSYYLKGKTIICTDGSLTQ